MSADRRSGEAARRPATGGARAARRRPAPGSRRRRTRPRRRVPVGQGREYGGALDLKLGPIEIKAIGLLDRPLLARARALGRVHATDPAVVRVHPERGRWHPGARAHRLDRRVAQLASTTTRRTRCCSRRIRWRRPHHPGSAAHGLPAPTGRVRRRSAARARVGGAGLFVTARLGVIIALPDPKVILIGRCASQCRSRRRRSSTFAPRSTERSPPTTSCSWSA